MFELSRIQRHLLFITAWIVGFVCIGVFGEAVMFYLKYIIGMTPLRPLMGGAGIFVLVVFVAMCLHYVTHRLTSSDNEK